MGRDSGPAVKTHPGRWQNYTRPFLGAFIVLGFLLLSYLGICGFVADRLSIPDAYPNREKAETLAIPYEDVLFPSRGDRLNLSGWLFPSRESRAGIILVHGKPGHRADPEIGLLTLAKDLHGLGYTVLTFDLRGWGTSQKSRFSLGQAESRDVLGAVDFLKSRGTNKVGVIGFSMGAAASILAAAQDTSIKALVEDSGYEDARAVVDAKLPRLSHLPSIFTPGVVAMVKLMYGLDIDAVKPIREVGKIKPRRIYFIHGDADTTIPSRNALSLFLGAGDPADDLWIVPGVKHVKAYLTHREEYLQRVGRFFGEELK